jgi:hypothetical protein
MTIHAFAVGSLIATLLMTGCADTFGNEQELRFEFEPPRQVYHDQEYRYEIVVSGGAGDSVVITAPTLPSWMTFDSVSRMLTGVAGSVNTGEHSVKLTASDGVNTTAITFTVSVKPNLHALQYGGSWIPIGFSFGHDGAPYESENFVVYSGFSHYEERQKVAEVLEECFVELDSALDVSSHEEYQYPEGRSRIDVLTLKHQGAEVLWTGQSYRYGMIVHSADSPRFVAEGYDRMLYRQLLKHELMHVVEYLLVGTEGDYRSTEKWLHEGIAMFLGGAPPNQIRSAARVQSWQTAMSGYIGGGNPIKIKTPASYPAAVAEDATVLNEYYLLFELAVRYLVDPNGLGRSVVDMKNLYLDIRRGDSFTKAFEGRLQLSVADYEANFFDLMRDYLR